jgi:hypothetical protein
MIHARIPCHHGGAKSLSVRLCFRPCVCFCIIRLYSSYQNVYCRYLLCVCLYLTFQLEICLRIKCAHICMYLSVSGCFLRISVFNKYVCVCMHINTDVHLSLSPTSQPMPREGQTESSIDKRSLPRITGPHILSTHTHCPPATFSCKLTPLTPDRSLKQFCTTVYRN